MVILKDTKIKDLKSCYDSQAAHFHRTRGNRKRPELEHLGTYLQLLYIDKNRPIRLLDLGCGSGRLLTRLETLSIEFEYIGTDFSIGMITEAKKNFPLEDFYCEDMLSTLRKADQQSYDCVICMASFHHLSRKSERVLCVELLYRALDYGGYLFQVNWSLSDWFKKKYYKDVYIAFFTSLMTLGYYSRNDIFVPWKDPHWQKNGIIYKRYYHLFTLEEIRKLHQLLPFSFEIISYITKDGSLVAHPYSSRNTILVAKKAT